jgi:putative PIN family toxin of toxin-antitoxin system
MISAVFDTNVLISAFISKGAPYRAMISVMDGRVKLKISTEIFEEFRKVISRKKFGFSKEMIERMELTVLNASEMEYPKEKIHAIKEDPQDNKILECAVASNADYIVSGDPHLLKLRFWKDIQIININEFLRTIEKKV